MNQGLKKILFSIVALLITFSFLSAAEKAPKQEKLEKPLSREAKVEKLFEKWNSLDSPGASVAVVKDGMVIYRNGFGSAQLEYSIPITPSTIFHVASVSKQFTAMAITMLEEQGKLSADDDIRKYLPELADFGKTITIRHLMHHTSGLRDQWELLVLSGWRMDDVITQKQIMDVVKRQKELNFPPGDRMMYSNTGYTLLAEIVSRVSGKPFTQWTLENIFIPLGMTSTHFHLDHEMIVKNRAYSYYKDKNKLKKRLLNYANVGATSLFTTVEDLVNWMRNFDEKRVGGEAVIKRMLTVGVLNNGKKITYARGIGISKYKGLKTITHSGADAGFRSNLLYFPDVKFGVVVLANLGSIQPARLCAQIADIYLADQLKQPKPPEKSPAAKTKAKQKKTKPVKISPRKLAYFTGTYWIESAKLLRKLTVDKNKLYYVRTDGRRTELMPVSKTSFKMIGVGVDVLVTFSDPVEKRYDTITVAVAGDPELKGKWTKPFEPTGETLKEYTGRYSCEELGVAYGLAIKDGHLVIEARNSDDEPLKAMIKDLFTFEGFVSFQFERGKDGAITGFKVFSSRIRNIRFTRL